MTKKDYILLANMLNACFNKHEIADKRHTVYVFAMELKNKNPRFDIAKFYKACGIEA